MNRTSLLLLILAVNAAAAGDVVRLSEPVVVTDQYEDYGEPLTVTTTPLDLATLLSRSDELAGVPVTVRTRVTRVCQKKGCFFLALGGDETVRISFRDYAFFVPTDIAGKTVILSGTLIERERSDEEAAHFADDLGEDAGSLQAGPAFEIVADSVRVPRS